MDIFIEKNEEKCTEKEKIRNSKIIKKIIYNSLTQILTFMLITFKTQI